MRGKSDLVLNVGSAINSLCENVATVLDDLVQMLNALAGGDLSRRITAHYEGSFALLKDNANKIAERVGANVCDIKAAAGEVMQQNSALVEENAATANTLESQARAMDERLAFFRLDEGAAQYRMAAGADLASAEARRRADQNKTDKSVSGGKPVTAAVRKANSVARMQNAIAFAWKDF